MNPEALAIQGAILALRKIKTAIINGTKPLALVTQIQTEIRELENWQRTGDRNPANVLEARG